MIKYWKKFFSLNLAATAANLMIELNILFLQSEVKDEIYNNNKELDKDSTVNCILDDAAFHNWSITNKKIESSKGRFNISRLGGMLSQINPIEYVINLMKRKFQTLENKTKIDALNAL